jgi:hypothetical protein
VIAVWASGLAAVALFAGLAWYLAPLQPNILALQFAFTPLSFARVVHAWPDEHLQRYLAHLRVDTLLLASYAAFGYLLATRGANDGRAAHCAVAAAAGRVVRRRGERAARLAGGGAALRRGLDVCRVGDELDAEVAAAAGLRAADGAGSGGPRGLMPQRANEYGPPRSSALR